GQQLPRSSLRKSRGSRNETSRSVTKCVTCRALRGIQILIFGTHSRVSPGFATDLSTARKMCVIRAVDMQEVRNHGQNVPVAGYASHQKRAFAPLRRPNSELRSREHLTQTEVEKLIEATKDNRYGHRDATMLLVAYRQGLRASEIVDLRWEQFDWSSATLHV